MPAPYLDHHTQRSRTKRQRRTISMRVPPDDECLDALSIAQFCRRHGISASLYYKLKRAKQNPVEMKVGSRTLISCESAAAWRRAREQVGKTEAAQTAPSTI